MSELPDRLVVVRRETEGTVDTFLALHHELEHLEHLWERYIESGRDHLLAVEGVAGEVTRFPVSQLTMLRELTPASMAAGHAISAAVTAIEHEVKRGILGPDYDPDRD